MAAELVDVEVRKNGQTVKDRFTSQVDHRNATDLEAFIRDMTQHADVSGPGCEVQIWDHHTGEDLGTYTAK